MLCNRLLQAVILLVLTCTIYSPHRALSQCAPDTLLKTISNPAAVAEDQFGASVAISGNLAVIGVPFADPGGPNAVGAAYVFNATTGALVTTLSNPEPQTLDYFGSAVAISGEVTVIGAYNDAPGGGSNAGSAYVFNATTGALQTTLVNPAPLGGDSFGTSVAISGNVAVVGANRDVVSGMGSVGTAYVFNATTGALIKTLNNPDPTMNDYFGSSVAVSGNTAVVGAYGDAGQSGTAYTFNATTGALIATLNNPTPLALDRFGSVAIDGNVAVIGAYLDDPAGMDGAGTAYVFDATTGALTQTLNNPAAAANEGFGVSVAISANMAVIGAAFDNPEGVADAGTAYVFNATTGALVGTLNNPAAAMGDEFGAAVAISEDIITVGAHLDDSGALNAGAAYTFSCLTYDGRLLGDFDGSHCTDLTDFLFLLDNWQAVSAIGPPAIGLPDFLALLDNWQAGPAC